MRFMYKNVSGETYPAYGCGRLKDFIEFDEASGNPIYELVKPDGVAGIYVINGANNIENDSLGVAVSLDNATLVLVDDTEDADGQPAAGDICGPTRQLWIATTSGSGFRAAGDPNNRVVPVTQQGMSRFQGKLTEDLLAAVNTKRDPSTAKARILFRKLDGDLTLSTKEVTIVNRFENISVDSGTYVKFEWMDGEWQLYAADCPADGSISESF